MARHRKSKVRKSRGKSTKTLRSSTLNKGSRRYFQGGGKF